MGVVFDAGAAGPGTHALVIGVGDYAHLVGGGGPLFPQHEGMGQLSSPPASARAVAQWLLADYADPARPLRSLELLLSEPAGAPFTLPAGAAPAPVERATFANVERAIKGLFLRAAGSADNRLVFYFCGHGVASGSQTTLLAEDFARDAFAPFTTAVDFSSLYLGFDKCAAREQCFFIDACRVGTRALFESFEYYGNPVIPGSAKAAATPRRTAVFHATLSGTRAHARPGRPSFFTEALLRAFRGAGCDDSEGTWRVQTDALQRGLNYLVERVASGSGADQLVAATVEGRFGFHDLAGEPAVPVGICCRPETCNEEVVFTCTGNGVKHQRAQPAAEPWDLELPPGAYEFSATRVGPPERVWSASTFVMPPFRKVYVKVV